MAASTNLTLCISQRELERFYYHSTAFPRKFHVTENMIDRIGLEATLEGHNGCVNCLEWNEKGTLLLSGSDDLEVMLWDPHKHKKMLTLSTGHHGNIFSVKFLPNSNDSVIATCAADYRVRVHDLQSRETTQVFSCHANRVKRLATAPNVPFMFWSAAEDGTVMQFDLRAPEMCAGPNPQNVLINLNAHLETHAEIKCLAINPLRPELLAVGANDPYVRLYDRRMLSCKSIRFPTDSNGSRSSPHEKHRLMAALTDEEEFAIPNDAVQYFVAGHLPQKQIDFKKRFRTLASTYVTFGPDGNTLLSNLGGEQIYLFDINRSRAALKYNVPLLRGQTKTELKDGYSLSTNGYTNHSRKHGCETDDVQESRAKRRRHRLKYEGKQLSPRVEALKQRAAVFFENQKYSSAIDLYNVAIGLAPNMAILHGNRAAAYMKRAWDGDLYAALRDCYVAIAADSNHLKAHFRLARCLHELGWTMEAKDCLEYFTEKFPEYGTNPACVTLNAGIQLAISKKLDEEKDREKQKEEKNGTSRNTSCILQVSESERIWRDAACDYESRYCGHCNTTTDIKEANFFGADGQYIVAGSDDGSFFIWDRHTTNIVRILRGDDSIVNCLQPHPSTCLLATSGIDPVVRLWSPKPEDGSKEERLVDNCDDAASANQKRMNADPLEVMLMNMGYRLTRDLEDGDEDDRGEATPCRPS